MRIPLKEYRDLLVTYLAPQRVRVAFLTFLLFSGTMLQLLNPQLLGMFIDGITNPTSHTSLITLAVTFILIALLQQALLVGTTYFSEHVGWSATNALRTDLTLHLLKLDPSFHKEYTPGALIERVDGDVTAMANFFSQFIIKIIGSFLLLIGIIIVLWHQDWRLGLPLALFSLLTLATMNYVRNVAVRYWKAHREASANLYGFLEERLRGTEDIRASGAQDYVLRRLYLHTRERLRTGRIARLISVIPWGIPMLFFASGNFMAFALALFFYRSNTISLGSAFLIYYYMQLLFQPIEAIAQQMEDLQKASAGFVRVRELLQIQSKLQEGTNKNLPAGPLEVSFVDVDFGYGAEEMVLHDISFRLQHGEVLGLLGRTGSGKTTISRLLFRLYDPAQGHIYVEGQDLRTLRFSTLRRRIGIVTQDVQLFHASVRDNLTFFDTTIDDAAILQVLRDLGLDSWFETLADGLDTVLAANGGSLSAGEAQLLAFARIFLHDPGLVILDEASSRLDPATEQLIEKAVERLLAGRTAIIIAHRLHTLQRADTIMILEAGKICEYGPRVRLQADSTSRFAQLLQAAYEEVLA